MFDINVHNMKIMMFLRGGNYFPLPVHRQPKYEIISLCPIKSTNLNKLEILLLNLFSSLKEHRIIYLDIR